MSWPLKRSVPCVFLVMVTMQTVVRGEEFFHQRSREDTIKYRVLSDKNVVTSEAKAEEVLTRYGYLRCGSRRRRVMGKAGKEAGEARPCSAEEVRKAIRQYQRTYNLPETGRLDPPTFRLLSESRCGNPDDETGAVPFRPMIRRKRKHWKNSAHGPPVRRYKRGASTQDDSDSPKAMNVQDTTPSSDQLVLHSSNSAVPEEALQGTSFLYRRRRFIRDYLQGMISGDLEKQAQTRHHEIQARRRRKRSLSNSVEGQAFPNEAVTWRLVGSAYSNQLTVHTQRMALSLAFRMWGEVIPLIFQEDLHSPVDDLDILIAFGKGEHLNCPNHFDGYGGQLSHAVKMALNAEIHVDDDEYLTVGSDHGTNLVKVAVHEVGHALGLFHTSRNYSIMYAIYSKVIPNNNFELGWEDRKMAQEIYGICKGRFDTVFDWVRRRPDGQLIYNTYYFRGPRYWMYENRFNRTRYGDPLKILPEWKGIPNDIDGFTHVWTYEHDSAYFFKGPYYYTYKAADDQVAAGFPRNISEDFRSIPGTGFPNIPGYIDTVYFDKRDANMYFFKGNLVYAYDVSRGKEGCCLPGYPRDISREFPSMSPESKLPSNLDAVYYSYTERAMFFFKGTRYWQNMAFNPLDRRRTNRVAGPWEISSKWFDICDVEL